MYDDDRGRGEVILGRAGNSLNAYGRDQADQEDNPACCRDPFQSPDPGRIPRRVPAVLAHGLRGLRLHEVRLRGAARWPDYVSGPLGTEDVEGLSIDGLEVFQ